MISEILSGGVDVGARRSNPSVHADKKTAGDSRGSEQSDAAGIRRICERTPANGISAPSAQKLSDEDEVDAWLGTLPRKTRFMLAMSISAVSLEKGQCRSRDDLVCFLSAAGLPITRQAIESIECRALRKCRRSKLASLAKEHLIRM